jgi:hypothetical protein
MSSTVASGGGGQGGGGSTSRGASSATVGSGGAGGGSGGSATGGSGGGTCARCSGAFDHNDPAPPSTLCTHNAPESSKQYFDAYETCCNTNCASRCDCAHPYSIPSGLCSLCRSQNCEPELLACGQCDSCAAVLQGTGDAEKLCTAGETPSAADRWTTLNQCACAACPDDCAMDACMNTPFGTACLACAQTNCPAELQSCASDDMPTSG